MRTRFQHNAFLFFGLLVMGLFAACAQVSNPTGGVKDTENPHPYDSISSPLNFTTSFASKTIELKFNEWIRLVDASNQIVISPPLETDAEFSLKKKSLIVDLDDNKLLENTTYTINFGNAIEDITESNKAKNLQYVFSTGTFIDSMMCFGNIINAFDLSPVENAVVMLYENTNDSVPLSEKPLYFTKTDKKGEYVIRYIKKGDYKVFVVQDANSNYLYDLPTEGIAYLEELITPGPGDSLSEPSNLKLFFEDNEQQFIKTSKVTEPGSFLLVMNKMDSTVKVNILNEGLDDYWAYSRHHTRGDSLTFWLPKDRLTDTLLLEIRSDTAVLDTLEVKIKRKEANSNSRKKEVKTAMSATVNARGSFDYFRNLVLTFSQPIDSVNQSQILLTKDSVPVPFEIIINDDEHRKLQLKAAWEPEENYQLFVSPGAVTDIYGLKSDTIITAFSIQKKHFYGIFNLDVTLPETGHNFVLQFYNQQGVILEERTLTGSKALAFENLSPGTYSIKLIYDENNNGAWDTGRYLEGRQPEKVIYFSDKIEIRSNWDLDLKWKVTAE
jgi:hypothetical protein